MDDFISDCRRLRANNFAGEIMSLLRDFLARDRDVQRRIHDHLWKVAQEHNLQIISVPPEFDALTKLQLERRMMEVHPMAVKLPLPEGDNP